MTGWNQATQDREEQGDTLSFIVMRAIQGRSQPDDREAIIRLMDSKDSMVQIWAFSAAVSVKDTTLIPEIEQRLTRTLTSEVRPHAEAAFKDLTALTVRTMKREDLELLLNVARRAQRHIGTGPDRITRKESLRIEEIAKLLK